MLNTKEGTRVKIGKVDCTQQNELCSSHEVTGYPTLKFFKVGVEESVKFRGTRDLPTLTNFINEQLGEVPEPEGEDDAQKVEGDVAKAEQGLIELTEENFGKHVATGKHFVKFYAPWCGHCQRLAPTWDELAKSLEYDGGVTIAKIDCTQHRPICQDFEVKGYPTLLWIEDGKKVEKYAGPRTHEDLKAYVEKMAGQPEKQKTEEKAEASAEGGEEQKQNLVLALTNDNFEHAVEKGTTFVKFFAPWCGHCKRMAPTWEQLAAKFVGVAGVKIAKVDCTVAESKELCSAQEVNGFPTLYVYRDGQKITEYDGSRSLEDLYDFVQKHSEEAKHDEL